MKFNLQKTAKTFQEHDLLAIGVFKVKALDKVSPGKKGKNSTTAKIDFGKQVHEVDNLLEGYLIAAANDEGFVGDEGQVFVTSTLGKTKIKSVSLMGCGDAHAQTVDHFRRLGGDIYKQAYKKKCRSLGIVLSDGVTVPLFDVIKAMSEGIWLAAYQFDRYITKDKKEMYLKDIHIYLSTPPTAELNQALSHAQWISESVCLARDLINEGPFEVNPQKLASMATDIAREHGLAIEIFDEKRLKKERMHLMLAVASAAQDFAPPRLVRLHYQPKKRSEKKIVLVGKGVTFDSGGLDLKTADGMLDMKTDMAGAACVLACMRAIAQLKPRVEVIGYMACVENGVGPKSFHPGDVIISRKGLSVEINNTDAEGRLILADTITYAIDNDQPDTIIDIATLTGACIIALGLKTAGLLTNSDQLHDEIVQAGTNAGESYWRLPLNSVLKEALKSPLADMKNTGDRYGGAITAALFLQEFVDDGVKWAHLDIAGPSVNNKPHAYLSTGGIGFGVRTLTSLLMSAD